MPRAAIYARKSSESDDRQVLSLSSQVAWAQGTCARLGISGPLIFQEARSAKMPGRPEFARMMALVAAGQIDVIVAWKADRLARNALDGGTVLYALESKQLVRIVTDDRTYNGLPDDELVLAIELGLSSKYSKDLSKNIRRGLAEKWRLGEWTSHAPVGYTNVRKNADRAIIVVDPKLGPRVQQLFRLAATGNASINDLAAIARDEWKVNLRQYRKDGCARGISPSAIHRILRNPFYYGAMRIKGQLYAGSHPPLVSKQVFDRVQRVLAERRTMAERPKRLSFAFSGLIRCNACGRRLVGYAKQKKGREYRYYACSKHLRGLCPEPQLSELQLVEAVLPVLHQVSIAERDLALVKQMLAEASVDHERDAASVRARAESELLDINRQRARLVDLLLEGAITRADYDRKQREFAEREAQYTLATGPAGAAGAAASWQEPVETYFAGLVDAHAAFTRGSADVRRGLIRQIGLELEARDKKPLVHAGRPATMMINHGGRPLTWWIVDNVRNYFRFRALLEGLLAIK
jgi:DNA invertase Pin-like site-specific DNA recombinase